MSAMISAFRVLTDPANTGAVCIAMPQDVEGEAYDYPESFFKKRVWRLERRPATEAALADAAEVIKKAKRPILVCGGGVRYSEAHEEFRAFAEATGIPFGETQAGKSAIEWTHPLNLGGLGVTGCSAANDIAKKADVVIGVGTRYTDFTTASKWLFKDTCKFVNINVSEFQALKMDAVPVVADAKDALPRLLAKLEGYKAPYTTEVSAAREKLETHHQRRQRRLRQAVRQGPGRRPVPDHRAGRHQRHDERGRRGYRRRRLPARRHAADVAAHRHRLL